ncbi:Putative DNA helicase [Tolypocladium paradoxum]|uniref:DNA helicase n=1 Tax=Tolypocladium paradoxum TaxID=94208 RepID=A0A2S4L0J5_9HYPO|nr:Putative DNA helicase [Tolypocladium paradoxum]
MVLDNEANVMIGSDIIADSKIGVRIIAVSRKQSQSFVGFQLSVEMDRPVGAGRVHSLSANSGEETKLVLKARLPIDHFDWIVTPLAKKKNDHIHPGYGLFVEGFRKSFVSSDEETTSWMNRDAPILGTKSLPDILKSRSFLFIAPHGKTVFKLLQKSAAPPRWMGYPYGDKHAFDMARYKTLMPGQLGSQYGAQYAFDSANDMVACLTQSHVQDVYWLFCDVEQIGTMDVQAALIPVANTRRQFYAVVNLTKELIQNFALSWRRLTKNAYPFSVLVKPNGGATESIWDAVIQPKSAIPGLTGDGKLVLRLRRQDTEEQKFTPTSFTTWEQAQAAGNGEGELAVGSIIKTDKIRVSGAAKLLSSAEVFPFQGKTRKEEERGQVPDENAGAKDPDQAPGEVDGDKAPDDEDEDDDEDVDANELFQARLRPADPSQTYRTMLVREYFLDLMLGHGFWRSCTHVPSPPPDVDLDKVTAAIANLDLNGRPLGMPSPPIIDVTDGIAPNILAGIMEGIDATIRDDFLVYLKSAPLGVLLLSGFAGAGKSQVTSVIASCLIASTGTRMAYVSSPTNVAVTNICDRISTTWSRIVDKFAEEHPDSNLRYAIVIRGFELRHEITKLFDTLRIARGGQGMDADAGVWAPTAWAMLNSFAFYTLQVLGYVGTDVPIMSTTRSSQALIDIKRFIDGKKEFENICSLARGDMTWEEYNDGEGGCPVASLREVMYKIGFSASVIATTPAVANSGFFHKLNRLSDVVVLDEAGAMTRADAISVWGNTGRPCVLAGDTNQLPPTMRESLSWST